MKAYFYLFIMKKYVYFYKIKVIKNAFNAPVTSINTQEKIFSYTFFTTFLKRIISSIFPTFKNPLLFLYPLSCLLTKYFTLCFKRQIKADGHINFKIALGKNKNLISS